MHHHDCRLQHQRQHHYNHHDPTQPPTLMNEKIPQRNKDKAKKQRLRIESLSKARTKAYFTTGSRPAKPRARKQTYFFLVDSARIPRSMGGEPLKRAASRFDRPLLTIEPEGYRRTISAVALGVPPDVNRIETEG
ncbi:hypothetical protein EX30DRAFT_339396 [Ascodesmis nigricans]|uniref:Uncharacterized protein n=1 Tax=Ascodesmis nigricans TaxID=341454 RepID=A0A4S2N292_9PEZI|nr:hypothetical protein EX30DRAFT_339396 [Ascodesmis nigricans]